MRGIDILTAAGVAFLWIGAAAAKPPMTGEARLARALEGRDFAKPVDCLTLRRVRSSRIIDRTAIIFEDGGTLYVNRPLAGAEALSDSLALVLKTPTGRICRGEAVQLFDASSHIQAGSVFLGEFVPYRKRAPAYSPPYGGGYSGSRY
jgi:hypothetical protein